MVASLILFSTTALLLSYINSEYAISGWTAASYRAVIGLIGLYFTQNKTGKLSITHVFINPLLFVRGLIGGLTIPIYYISIIELGPRKAGLIGGSYPLFAAIFALLFLKEKVPKNYATYSFIAMAGLVGLFYTHDFSLHSSINPAMNHAA